MIGPSIGRRYAGAGAAQSRLRANNPARSRSANGSHRLVHADRRPAHRLSQAYRITSRMGSDQAKRADRTARVGRGGRSRGRPTRAWDGSKPLPHCKPMDQVLQSIAALAMAAFVGRIINALFRPTMTAFSDQIGEGALDVITVSEVFCFTALLVQPRVSAPRFPGWVAPTRERRSRRSSS